MTPSDDRISRRFLTGDTFFKAAGIGMLIFCDGLASRSIWGKLQKGKSKGGTKPWL
jgi:hypothetical protein